MHAIANKALNNRVQQNIPPATGMSLITGKSSAGIAVVGWGNQVQ